MRRQCNTYVDERMHCNMDSRKRDYLKLVY